MESCALISKPTSNNTSSLLTASLIKHLSFAQPFYCWALSVIFFLHINDIVCIFLISTVTYFFSLWSFCSRKKVTAFSVSYRQTQHLIPTGHWFAANKLEKQDIQFEKCTTEMTKEHKKDFECHAGWRALKGTWLCHIPSWNSNSVCTNTPYNIPLTYRAYHLLALYSLPHVLR